MSDTLDTLLVRLAALTPQAQRRWEAAQRADEDNDYDEDDEIEGEVWLTLEQIHNHWSCGYRVRQDEATVWVFYTAGNTPMEAAQALLKLMEESNAPTT